MEEIQTRMIIEVMGRPKENVVSALKNIIDKIKEEKGVNVTNSAIRVPVLVKDSDKLFTSFAEIHANFDSIMNYFRILFTYMPSNTEIIKPEGLKLRNDETNEFANAILARLHDYYALAKKIVAERDAAIFQLKNLNVKTDMKPIGILQSSNLKKSVNKTSKN